MLVPYAIFCGDILLPIGSMVLPYMVTWIPFIYPLVMLPLIWQHHGSVMGYIGLQHEANGPRTLTLAQWAHGRQGRHWRLEALPGTGKKRQQMKV